jgi:hypothetical protein
MPMMNVESGFPDIEDVVERETRGAARPAPAPSNATANEFDPLQGELEAVREETAGVEQLPRADDSPPHV